jgi:hypothetical protein
MTCFQRCVDCCGNDRVTEGAQVTADVADTADNVHKSTEKHDRVEAEHGDGEGNTSAEFASSADADVDLMDEDPSQDAWSQATGKPYANVASVESSPFRSPGRDAQWSTALRQHHKHSPAKRANKSNVSLDDAVVGIDTEVNAFELPAFEEAERLLQCYMENCHNSFPFLAKKAFIRQFYDCT